MTTIKTTVSAQPVFGGMVDAEFVFTNGELSGINVRCGSYVRTSNMDVFGKTISQALVEEPRSIHIEFNDRELQLTFRGIMFRYIGK